MNNTGIITVYISYVFTADDVTEEIPSDDGSIRIVGLQSFLPKEDCSQIIMLPILEHGISEVSFKEQINSN